MPHFALIDKNGVYVGGSEHDYRLHPRSLDAWPGCAVVEVPDKPEGFVIFDAKKRVLVEDVERNKNALRDLLVAKKAAHLAAADELDSKLAGLVADKKSTR